MDVAITELEKIEADRIDGVGMPANGIPVLLFKQVAPEAAPDADAAKSSDEASSELCPLCKGEEQPGCHGCNGLGQVTTAKAKTLATLALVKAIVGRKVDESPDIAGGNAVISQIADLIIAEAQELKAGNTAEIDDIQQLACAAEMIWCWRTGEEAVASGSVQPATALMQSAAETAVKAATAGVISLNEAAGIVRDLAKATHSAADRRKLAEQGNALSDGSYPIADEHDLHSAAVLARSGHGDAAAAKKLIARRAKELGVANPLDTDDTAKGQIAKEGTSVDTETQTGELTELVKAAVTEAAAPLLKRVDDLESSNKALAAELAKVKATPVPGGPVISAVRPANGQDSEDYAAKARYFDEWAERVSDPAEQANYRQLAARERAKIIS